MEFVTEFTKSQIAVLVLGYLKSEKCYKAFDEFLEESPYFQKNKQNIKMGKYLVTRVAGMCLVDLLEEYATIYSIVQGRLEATDYYCEVHTKTTLVEQILYLLDKERVMMVNSTPFSVRSEVDATPAHTLPGHGSEEGDLMSKTPKKKSSRSKSTNNKNLDKDEAFDVSEVLTQTLLDNHELHEKIAETINIVRNTPEVAKTVPDEHISANASKELDAIIKTVVQKTEEDPIYHKLIDDIIGTAPFDNAPTKKATPASNNTPQILPEQKRPSDKPESQRIDDHNNDAVRSIIEASQNPEPPPEVPQSSETGKNENGEVYVFDGTLDTYLKSSGGTNPVTPNPVYINTGGLIVMPPETTSKQFYIVNNQPLINMNMSAVKGVISDNDIMSMPTIIVSDETQSTFTNQNFSVATTANKNTPINKRNKTPKIAPKAASSEVVNLSEKKKSKTIKGDPINSIATMSSEPTTTPSVVTSPTPRPVSHVRNLDFSTPQRGETTKSSAKKERMQAWDADLRSLARNCVDKCPTPKRKRPTSARPKKKTKAKNKFEEKLKEAKDGVADAKSEESKEEVAVIEPETNTNAKENPLLATPVKETPKTPGLEVATSNNSFHCTPFNDVLEEQLRGVDLISLPTPKIPLTPGFALNLTPADLPPYNRSTDYSTSSSYYQPSDTEQNKSLEQLIEDCRKLESKSPPPQEKLKILSDVIIEQAKIPKTIEKKNCEDHLKKFNHNVIGKKNLSLLKQNTSSSSSESDSSDTESDKSCDNSNKTIISKDGREETEKSAATIGDIISTVEVKNTLDEETRKKNLLSHLEEVRKRTVLKIKNPPESAKKTRNKKPAQGKTPKAQPKKNNRKKKESSVDGNNTDDESQKLLKGLAQRGILLMPTKTPKKKNSKVEKPPPKEEDDDSYVIFDKKCFEDFEIVTHDEKSLRGKSLKNYDLEVLKKGFEAKVYAEHLKEEVTRTMRWTNFEMIADLPAKINILTPRKTKRSEEEVDNDLMDYVFIGSVREESPDAKQTSKGGKKRKSRSSEDDIKQTEKKSKTYELNMKLLKKIDVDMFLDKVHGE